MQNKDTIVSHDLLCISIIMRFYQDFLEQVWLVSSSLRRPNIYDPYC